MSRLPSWWAGPYALWVTPDGEVIVNRSYSPILVRDFGGVAEEPEPGRWYEILAERWLYFAAPGHPSPKNSAAVRKLQSSVLRRFALGEPVADDFTWTLRKMDEASR